MGMDENENSEIPPSIILAEFIDFLHAAQPNFAITRHPLQPFSPLNFNGTLQSFSRQNFNAARMRQKSQAPKPFCPDELAYSENFFPADEYAQVSLKQLNDFFRHPARHFLKHQLGTSLWQEKLDELPDSEEFDSPDGLQKYTLRQNVIQQLLKQDYDSFQNDQDRSELLRAIQLQEIARGELPYGSKGVQI